jgi:hypothetical protein
VFKEVVETNTPFLKRRTDTPGQRGAYYQQLQNHIAGNLKLVGTE